jgi:cytoplasmic iron level regulating protein YaaA (DUF328/UPF0246 family)
MTPPFWTFWKSSLTRPDRREARSVRIALVSCVKQKQSRPAPARELYTSDLFCKMRAFAERHADHWYILSARYGLVHPDSVIAPYEQTLKGMGAAARRAWAEDVFRQLDAEGVLSKKVSFLWLAGSAYQRDLAPEQA